MSRGEVEVRIGDVTDSEVVRSAVRGVDVVIHLAALLHIVNPPAAMRERYDRVNVGGTATLVGAALQTNVRRVVLFSTISVYGTSRGREVTEDTPPAPDSFYSGTKLAAERIVLGAKRADGEPLGVVLRLAAVYGSRIKGNYRRLLRMLARRRFVAVGDGRNRRTLVYDRDVARAAVLAADHPAAAGRIYNVTDGQVHTMNEIVKTMCDALGRTPPCFRLPVGPVRLAAGALDDAAGLLGCKSPIGRAAIDKYTEDVAVEGRRIQAELGFRPQYNLAAGWQEAIQEMRRAGEL
jgi:UDP-glucose 4-epimerase